MGSVEDVAEEEYDVVKMWSRRRKRKRRRTREEEEEEKK